MNSRDLLSAFAERLGWTVIHSLWQGAAIAGALYIVLLALRRRSAAAKHAACFVGMVLLLLAGIATAFYDVAPALSAAPAITPPEAVVRSTPLELPPEPRRLEETFISTPIENVGPVLTTPLSHPPAERIWQERLHPYLRFIAYAWCAGVLLLSLRHFGACFRILSWRRHGRVLDSATAALFERVCEHLTIGVTVAVRHSATALAPMLIGVLRPMVIIPARLLTGLTEEQLEAVFAHELAHLVRRDHWTNLAQVIIETIFFYHPATWWMSRRTRIEREHAADDLALQVYADRRGYAGALARLAELEVAPAIAVAANGGTLLQRIRRIVLPPPRDTATPGWTVSVTAAIALFGVFLLMRTMADDPVIITVKSGESLQQAIDAAPAGAIVRLGEGRWTERIRLTKPVKIEGAGWEKTILWPDRHDPEAGKRHATLLERLKHHPAATQTVIREIVREIGPVDEPTILVQDTTAVSILGIKVKGFTTPKTLAGVKQGISSHCLVRVQNGEAEFKDSVFTGYFRGFDIQEKGSATIDACLIAGLWSEGLVAHPNSKLRLTNSEARNCSYAGVVLRQGSDALIEKCRISGAAWHGVRYDDASPVLRGNVIFGNARMDIYASGKTKATVQNNLLLSGGIWALLGNQDTIENNTFAGPRAGVGVSGGATPAILRNIFFGQDVAIPCSIVNSEEAVASVMGEPKIEGNVFWNTKAHLKFGEQTRPLPPNNFDEDTHFVDAQIGNYALTDTSPARTRNAGASSPLNPTSPWQLLAEEKAILPDGETRDSRYWKEPGGGQPSKARDELIARAREDAKPWVADALQLDDEARRTAAIASVRAAIESDDTTRIRTGLGAFQRIGQVAFDKTAFRPALRRLLKHAEADIRATACSVLAATGRSEEDIPLVIPLTEDEDYEVKKAAAWALKWLTGGDFTGEAGRAVQKVLEQGNKKLNDELWGTMWGTKISPELERIVVEASRKDDQGTGYSNVFYHALSVHQSKRELSVTRLIELLATEDPHNVGGRVLWGLQQGVDPDQRPRVAEAAMKVIAAREDGYMRREAFDCLRMYGSKANTEAMRALLAKPGVTGDFKAKCEKTLAMIERRP